MESCCCCCLTVESDYECADVCLPLSLSSSFSLPFAHWCLFWFVNFSIGHFILRYTLAFAKPYLIFSTLVVFRFSLHSFIDRPENERREKKICANTTQRKELDNESLVCQTLPPCDDGRAPDKSSSISEDETVGEKIRSSKSYSFFFRARTPRKTSTNFSAMANANENKHLRTIYSARFRPLNRSPVLIAIFVLNCLLVKISATELATYAGSLSFSSPTFTRPNAADGSYYYEALPVIISISGTYSFLSFSTTDMFGVLYADAFDPNYSSRNLLAIDDDGAGDRQFLINVTLSSTRRYILVMTTYETRMNAYYVLRAYGSGLSGVTLITTGTCKEVDGRCSCV